MVRYFLWPFGCANMYVRLRGSRGSPSIRNELQTQTGAYGIPVCLVLLHCIRTFRVGFESYSTCSNTFKEMFPLIRYLSKSNTPRTRFESRSKHPITNPYKTFTSSVKSVHELRQERSRAPSGAFTSPIGGI